MPEQAPNPLDPAKLEAVNAASARLRQNPAKMRAALRAYGVIDDPLPYNPPLESHWADNPAIYEGLESEQIDNEEGEI